MPFISFSFLTPQLETPVECWVEAARVDFLALFLILWESLQFFTIKYDVSYVNFYRSPLSSWRHFPCICWCFYNQRILDFVQCFFCVYLDIIFCPISTVYYIDWFPYVDEHPCITGINFTSHCVQSFSYVAGSSLLVFYYVFLHLHLQRVLAVIFLSYFCLDLVSDSHRIVGKCFLLSLFLEKFVKYWF